MDGRDDYTDQAHDILGKLVAGRRQAREAARAQADPAEISQLNRQAVSLILAAREELDPDQRELIYKEAETLLREAEGMDDGHPVTCTNWGALLCDVDADRPSSGGIGYKRPASWAKHALARAIHEGSTDGTTFFNMAVALTKLGRAADGEGFLEESYNLDAHPETVAALFQGETPKPSTAHDSGFDGQSDAEIVERIGAFFDDYQGEKPIIAFVDRMILAGQRLVAREIVLEPTGSGFRLGFRLSAAEDWTFPEKWIFPTEHYRPTVARFKIVAGLDLVRRDVQQEGQYSQNTALGPIAVAVSTVPTPDGERVLARYL